MPNATTTGIGASLRSARETLGISFEEAAWRTRIRPEYLRALEEERFDAIGGFARGQLHSYARFLGLDAAEIVRSYRKAFEREERSPVEQLGDRVVGSKRPPKPKWVTAAVVCSLVLIAASVAGLVRGPGPRTSPASNRSALPTLPGTAQQSPDPELQAAVPGAPGAGVTIVVVLTGRSWVRAVVDGTLAFEGTLPAGERKEFAGAQKIDLTIGNAGEVRLVVNGTDLGPPGPKGQIYRSSFGPQGEVKPQ